MSGAKTVFLRALEELHDKALALRRAIRNPDAVRKRQRFDVDPLSFSGVPGAPFAYWVSDRLRATFRELPPFETTQRAARVGIQTSDDFRFVRAWWGVSQGAVNQRWLGFAKGGAFSPFYADVYLAVNWEQNGREIRHFYKPGSDRLASRPQNIEYFFRAGLTWPRRTKSELSLRVLPAHCTFADKGPALFVGNNDPNELLSLLAIGSSSSFRALVEFQLAAADARPGGAAHSYEVGILQRTPVPSLAEASRKDLAALARRAWSLRRSIDTGTETSHAFTLPALLQVAGGDLAARTAVYSKHVRTIEAELVVIQAKIDAICFELYAIDENDRHDITGGFGGNVSEAAPSDEVGETDDDSGNEDEQATSVPDPGILARDLVGWVVGVAFGRFDVRLATGANPMPPEPEPFDRLPPCSPGMFTREGGSLLVRPPSGYPLEFAERGVLVDDRGHARDLTVAVRAAFDVVFGADTEEWWNNVAAVLDAKGHELRGWLAGEFFEHHLKRYSKSRRRAPIYWQLSTPSMLYSVWLYAHRLTPDSFFELKNEVIGRKLIHEERRLTTLIQNAGGSPSASERREIAAQEAFVDELRTMLEEVQRIAPMWHPNLDDGVVLTMAPLWRLVPQHKLWQKELKSKWDELVAGQYDWAHLAMHLWPERVVPKCATDRSLAIAHKLEDVFWLEEVDGKWKPRKVPKRPVDELVLERTSVAIKAALKSVLEASVSHPRGGRTHGRRAATTASEGGTD